MIAPWRMNQGREDRSFDPDKSGLGPPTVVAVFRPRHKRVAQASSLCRNRQDACSTPHGISTALIHDRSIEK